MYTTHKALSNCTIALLLLLAPWIALADPVVEDDGPIAGAQSSISFDFQADGSDPFETVDFDWLERNAIPLPVPEWSEPTKPVITNRVKLTDPRMSPMLTSGGRTIALFAQTDQQRNPTPRTRSPLDG